VLRLDLKLDLVKGKLLGLGFLSVLVWAREMELL
jgi:hypothetical protein